MPTVYCFSTVFPLERNEGKPVFSFTAIRWIIFLVCKCQSCWTVIRAWLKSNSCSWHRALRSDKEIHKKWVCRQSWSNECHSVSEAWNCVSSLSQLHCGTVKTYYLTDSVPLCHRVTQRILRWRRFLVSSIPNVAHLRLDRRPLTERFWRYIGTYPTASYRDRILVFFSQRQYKKEWRQTSALGWGGRREQRNEWWRLSSL